MSYVVLARKWRPMSFEDLIGQGHVSRTLGNAITSGRVAHAFLFTGVRGVGKTTSARILAKALNCMGTADSPRTGPSVTPCLTCPACTEIAAGTDVDVREIDGASYNGVDEVRKLQDSLPYRPARDRFKIFIVDEVHMLSQSAWNAFLKTLEEPPPHVKFIFATTEVHKVPVTILSRVQRFDFKLIPTQLIARRLKHVLDAEGIRSDDAALSIIAREAAGSMRDAMSLLDQVIAWNDQALDADGVSRVLGVASRQILHDLAGALVGGDPARCLHIVGQLAEQGYDISTVARDTLAVLRDLVVARACTDTSELLDLPDDEARDVRALAERTGIDDLVRLHQGMSGGFDDVVRGGQPRAALEMLLVRLARRPPLIPVDDLIQRLSTLERRLAAGAARPGGPPPQGPRGGGGADAPPRGMPDRSGPGPRPQGREARTAAPGGTPSPEPAEEPPRAPPRRAEPQFPEYPGPPPGDAGARNGTSAQGTSSGPPPPSVTPAEAQSLAAFRAVVELVRQKSPQLASLLHHAALVRFDAEHVVLAFEQGTIFEKNTREAETIAIVRDALQTHFGRTTELSMEVRGAGRPGVTVSALESQEREERQREALARAKQHPSVELATRILGARLKEIRLPDS